MKILVFLIRGESDIHLLDDGEVFEVGGRSFKWKFPCSSNCMFDEKPSEIVNNICVQADETLSEGVSNVCVQADEAIGEGDNNICVPADEDLGEGDNNIYVKAYEDLCEGDNNICVKAYEALGEGDNNICVQADEVLGEGDNNICVQADEDLREGDNNICVKAYEALGEGDNNICVQADEVLGEGDNNICVQADEDLREGDNNICVQADEVLGEGDNNICVQADEALGEGDNKICVQANEALGEGDYNICVQADEALGEGDNKNFVQADEDLGEGINNIGVQNDEDLGKGINNIGVQNDEDLCKGINNICVQNEDLAKGIYNICVQNDEDLGKGINNICVQNDEDLGKGINNICVQNDEDLGKGINNICVQNDEDLGKGINNICVQNDEDLGKGINNVCEQNDEDLGKGINNICVHADEALVEGDNNICVQADEELDHNIIKIIVQSDEEPSDDVYKMNMQTDEDSNEDIYKIKAQTESPAVSMPDCQRKVFFCGVQPNNGFLMLFKKYVLTENVDEAHIIVVKASAHGQTDCSCVELFESLVQREKTILSYKWIKESLLAGNILDMENFTVKSLKQYGEICKKVNFETFEFEIRGEKWMDITKGQVSRLLKHMGGLPVIHATADTVVICADDMLHTSSQCVSKEWIFECIVRGKIIRQHLLNANQNDIVYESDESSVLSFPMLDKVLVETSGSLKGKRTLKKQCCIYCEKLDYKLSRHMEMYHHDELEVAKILSLKKGSRERKSAWAALTAKGNHLHNSKVREKGVGILIPKYRPSSTQEQKRYLPCEYCRMLFVSSDLWKHHHRCVKKPEGEKSDGPVHNARLLLPVSAEVSKEFHEAVIVKIRDDAIGCKAKSDPSITAFGERRYEKTGKHEHTHAHIACRMRELARLVLAMSKKNSSADTLLKCIQPVLWSSLLKTIKEEAGFNPETQTLSSPSYAEKVGHSLKKTAKMLRTKASEAGDDAMKERMDCFIDMYNDEYFDRIGFMARETLTSANFNKIKLLPLVEDVAKLSNYLVKQVNNIKGDKTGTLYAYTNLCKLLLSQIILFNRKRAGEVERLKKEDFLKCSVNQNVDEEIKKSLTEFEKHLCHSHLRVETRGKRGRKVAILFTQTMKANIDHLLQLQSELNINSKYVFIRPNGKMPFRGADVLREVSLQADLKHAKRITSTSLRKQLATMCQVLNLTESSQDILARFMGHDIRIHRAYYRLPQSTLEVAKVSKILHLFNTGKITQTDVDLQDIDVQTFVEEEEPSDEDDEHNSASPSTTICEKTRKAESRPRFGLRMEESDADENDDVGKDPDWMYNKRKDAPSSDDADDERQPERKKRKVGIRIKWTQKQKEIVRGAFEQHIHLGKLPGKTECVNLITQNVHLRNRTWKNIKDFVRNQTVVLNRTLRSKKK
ncbi:uncharacterized protein LOC132752863 [Ruditapes philippinarum]|uniref:uncharacterized protein LOC132752863 n=1 Tax=Ruditapes philippinarum TaxID=129788 RepID=UPI00295B690D|nr:uncharacterized protein LOC132752863 [Ruditapes philippinarum]